jgi:hypothetical protein
MKMIQTLLICALVVTSVSAFAQWQWIDKDGRKVFSDRAPPSEILEKNILKRPGVRANAVINEADALPAGDTPMTTAAALPVSAPKASALDKEVEAKKKLAAEAEAAKRKAEEDRITKAKIESCAGAKQAKANLDSGVRISRINAAGEREVMDDSARASELKRILAVMNSDCK